MRQFYSKEREALYLSSIWIKLIPFKSPLSRCHTINTCNIAVPGDPIESWSVLLATDLPYDIISLILQLLWYPEHILSISPSGHKLRNTSFVGCQVLSSQWSWCWFNLLKRKENWLWAWINCLIESFVYKYQ